MTRTRIRLEDGSSYKIEYSGAFKAGRNDRKRLNLLVGASRFELETSCAQGRRATRLRYAPTDRGPQF